MDPTRRKIAEITALSSRLSELEADLRRARESSAELAVDPQVTRPALREIEPKSAEPQLK